MNTTLFYTTSDLAEFRKIAKESYSEKMKREANFRIAIMNVKPIKIVEKDKKDTKPIYTKKTATEE